MGVSSAFALRRAGGCGVVHALRSDAAILGTRYPALCGNLYGSVYVLRLTPEWLEMPIVVLEFLGGLLNLVVFGTQLRGAPCALLLDALVVPTVMAGKAKAPMMRFLQLRFIALVQKHGLNIEVGHEYGPFNPICDAGSRGKTAEMEAIMENLDLNLAYVNVPAEGLQLVAETHDEWVRLSEAERAEAHAAVDEMAAHQRQHGASADDDDDDDDDAMPQLVDDGARWPPATPARREGAARPRSEEERQTGRARLNTDSSGPSPYIDRAQDGHDASGAEAWVANVWAPTCSLIGCDDPCCLRPEGDAAGLVDPEGNAAGLYYDHCSLAHAILSSTPPATAPPASAPPSPAHEEHEAAEDDDLDRYSVSSGGAAANAAGNSAAAARRVRQRAGERDAPSDLFEEAAVIAAGASQRDSVARQVDRLAAAQQMPPPRARRAAATLANVRLGENLYVESGGERQDQRTNEAASRARAQAAATRAAPEVVMIEGIAITSHISRAAAAAGAYTAARARGACIGVSAASTRVETSYTPAGLERGLVAEAATPRVRVGLTAAGPTAEAPVGVTVEVVMLPLLTAAGLRAPEHLDEAEAGATAGAAAAAGAIVAGAAVAAAAVSRRKRRARCGTCDGCTRDECGSFGVRRGRSDVASCSIFWAENDRLYYPGGG